VAFHWVQNGQSVGWKGGEKRISSTNVHQNANHCYGVFKRLRIILAAVNCFSGRGVPWHGHTEVSRGHLRSNVQWMDGQRVVRRVFTSWPVCLWQCYCETRHFICWWTMDSHIIGSGKILPCPRHCTLLPTSERYTCVATVRSWLIWPYEVRLEKGQVFTKRHLLACLRKPWCALTSSRTPYMVSKDVACFHCLRITSTSYCCTYRLSVVQISSATCSWA